MSRFVNIGFYDLSSVYASYLAKHRRGLVESASPLHHGVRVLEMVNDREEAPILAEWKSAQAFLQRVGAQLKQLPQPAEVLNAFIRCFEPGGYEDWNREDLIDPDSFMRVHALLAPCPGFTLHADAEAIQPPVWYAFATEHRGHLSISNFAAPTAAHLLTLELALDVGD